MNAPIRESLAGVGLFDKIIATLLLASAMPLSAEQSAVARLTKIVVFDAEGLMNPDATIGNMIVESVGRSYRKYVVDKSATVAEVTTKMTYCDMAGTRDVLQVYVKDSLKKLTKADKALLRAGDAAPRRQLALDMIGELEGIAPASIEQDEAIGPGVYHDPIAGMEYVLQTCGYYGQL